MQLSPELAIRAARAAFNQALASGDLAAIAPLLAPDVVLVAGTDSAVIHGRKAQLQAWKREFSAKARSIYSRIPDAVLLSPVAPIAFEHGHWQGVSAADSTLEASGTYTAKWREIGGLWRIEAELYLTLA